MWGFFYAMKGGGRIVDEPPLVGKDINDFLMSYLYFFRKNENLVKIIY